MSYRAGYAAQVATKELGKAAVLAFAAYVLLAVSLPATTAGIALKVGVLGAAIVLALAWAWSSVRQRRQSQNTRHL